MTAKRFRAAFVLGVVLCFFAAIPLAGATNAPAFVLKWGSFGSGDGQFGGDPCCGGPEGVAVDGSGNVYVADTGNGRYQKFTGSGAFLAKSGSFALGNGPFGIAVDGSGNVYVSNAQSITKFDGSGTLLATWGGPAAGSGDGQFAGSRGVAVDGSGNVYVADYLNSRIQKFDSSGTFLTKWGSIGAGDGQFGPIDGIAADGAGNVYVASNNRIQKFDSSGTFLTKWGSTGTGDGQFIGPAGLAVDGSGNVYVADHFNFRIEKFSQQATNNAPLGVDDSYGVLQGHPKSFDPAHGVLADDTDPDPGTTLTAVLVGGPAHGTLALNTDGSFTYTANAVFSGVDSFTYRASDGSLLSNVVTVRIFVDSAALLIDSLTVGGLLTSGQGNSLNDKLRVAEAFFSSGKLNAACGKLDAFIAQVNDLTTKLSPPIASILITVANARKQLYGCVG